MAEIKLRRTAYRYSDQTSFLFKLVPALLLSSAAIIINTDLLNQLKIIFLSTGTVIPTIDDTTDGNTLETKKFLLGDFSITLLISRVIRTLRSLPTKEVLLILFIFLTIFTTLLLLSSTWSLSLKLLVFYRKCVHREGTQGFCDFVATFATHIYITEVVDEQDMLNEPKRRSGDAVVEVKHSPRFTYYIHDHKKFIFDVEKCKFVPVRHLDNVDVSSLSHWKGLTAKAGSSIESGLERSTIVCSELYGPNDYEIPQCNFWKMLMEAFLAPFFQFQMISTLLWILDDYVYYSLISVASIIMIEAQMVYKRILEYNRINSMRLPPSKLLVYRDSKWVSLSSLDLYPGDIIHLSIDNDTKPTVAPADSLILSGEVVVDESILTGESIPQFKSAIEEGIKSIRSSTVFAGTTIMTCRQGVPWNDLKLPSKSGCLCLVLRTGFESYQGRLVHAIMHSGDTVSASTKEGWAFLSILLSFSLIACGIVFKNSPSTSIKKLLLVSVRIVTSVIPPEFPVTLSIAVTIAILQLRKKGLYCTEPFRLPLAGIIDVCAFDKTGTLSDDSMRVVGIAFNETDFDTEFKNDVLPITAPLVVGGCHSLVKVGNSVTGDPMEKVAFEYFGWDLTGANSVDVTMKKFFNKCGPCALKIRIIRRFQFTAELGRMSVLASITGDGSYWVSDPERPGTRENAKAYSSSFDGEQLILCKGSPEHVRKLLHTVPPYYDDLYQRMAIRGLRVLSLAYKRMDNPDVATLERPQVESELEFAGFLALEAPIKPSCLLCMRRLTGHKIIMITGDNVLTACHVAQVTEIADKRKGSVPSHPRAKFLSYPTGVHGDNSRGKASISGSTSQSDVHNGSPVGNVISAEWNDADRWDGYGDFIILTSVGGNFHWKTRDGRDVALEGTSGTGVPLNGLINKYRLCITGPTLDALLGSSIDKADIINVILSCTVFARMSPQQKELVIRTFKRAGKITSMCGDGTNDVAALKEAHVGLSLLNNPIKKPLKPEIKVTPTKDRSFKAELLKESLNDELPPLKLGEASIASPFTYHRGDVLCMPTLVKSGRCTLSNVVMLYKLMGINSLVTAMGMSVLALDGVNFSDAQTTLYSLLYTYLVVALSKSKPSDEATTRKPASSIFSPCHFLSLSLQLILHGCLLLYVWELAKGFRPTDYVGDLDAPFSPNIVNTVVYYACFAINIASFVSNYQAYPYMEPLKNNKFVYKPLMLSLALLAIFLSDLVEPLANFLSLVPIPSHTLRLQVAFALTLDIALSILIDKGINYIFW